MVSKIPGIIALGQSSSPPLLTPGHRFAEYFKHAPHNLKVVISHYNLNNVFLNYHP